MSESHIAGKDAPLEVSSDNMQQQLQTLGFHIEEASWLNPVSNVWSVHIRDQTCPLLFTNGKGATQKAALASALGEFFERLSCNYFWADFYLGEAIANAPFVHYPNERWFLIPDNDQLPDGLLNQELLAFYDPERVLAASKLVDLNSGNHKRGICALPYTCLDDNQDYWIPVNLIGNLYVSNGMSAGNTPTEAKTQALSEIFERYVKARVITEGLCLPFVPEAVIDRFPMIRNGIKDLESAGYRIQVRDASLDGHFPVMCVLLLNPKDQGCYASFGAHPQFEIALERALTELLQGRALDKLAGFPPPELDLEEVAHPFNLETHFVDSSGLLHWNFLSQDADFPFNDWNFSGNTEQEYAWLCEKVRQNGNNIYLMEYQHLGVYACRVLVPGMSEIYPPDDLEWDNNNAGIDYRQRLLTLHTLTHNDWQNLLNQLEEQGFDNMQPVAALIGLAPDPHSAWQTLRIGELKTLLALAINDVSAIMEGCQWIAQVNDIPEERKQVYHCIHTLISLEKTAPYHHSLEALYGAKTLQTAIDHVAQDAYFMNLSNLGLLLQGCQLHQRLLEAYQKVHPQLAT